VAEASLKLQRILAIAAVAGFVVPIASFMEWRLLTDWRWPPNLIGMVDGFFISNVLPIAAINVPLYMALGLVWWAFARHKKATLKPL
jgi:hypothetical protein